MSVSNNPVPLQGDLTRDLETLSSYAEDLDARIDDILSNNAVNVKDYGAVGDGVTDDTEAIQTAFTTAMDNGVICAIPSGVYNITNWTTFALTDKIIIKGSGCKLVGDKTAILFSNVKVGLNLDGIWFHNLISLFNDAYAAVVNSDTDEFSITNCKFTSLFNIGTISAEDASADFSLISSKNMTFSNNYISECGSGFSYKTLVNGYSVHSNVFESIGSAYMADTPFSDETVCIRVGVDTQSQNTYTDNQGSGSVIGNSFRDVVGHAITGSNKVAGILLVGRNNIISGNSFKSLYSTNSSSINVEAIYTKGSNLVINGNTLIDAGTTEAAIRLKGSNTTITSEVNVVSGNIIEWTTAPGSLNRRGICSATGNCIISGNYIKNASHLGIAVDSGDDVLIDGNQIVNIFVGVSASAGMGIQAINSNNLTITNNSITLDGSTTGTVTGVKCEYSGAYSDGVENLTISGNKFTMANELGSITDNANDYFRAIRVYDNSNGIGVMNITNNVSSIRGAIRRIYNFWIVSVGLARTVNISGNVFDNDTTAGTNTDITYTNAGGTTTFGYNNNVGFTTSLP